MRHVLRVARRVQYALVLLIILHFTTTSLMVATLSSVAEEGSCFSKMHLSCESLNVGENYMNESLPRSEGIRSRESSWYESKSRVQTIYSLALLRAIGNALPPRHDSEQTLRNLQFTLENEESFPGMTKHWFVNRVVNSTVEASVIDLLQRHNQSYTVIPFEWKAYNAIPYQFHRWGSLDFLHSEDFRIGLPYVDRLKAHETMGHEKILYTMNVNGVRNQMIEFGQSLNVDFVLPWDGNCFMTPPAWQALQDSLQLGTNYYLVPMDRFPGLDNREILSANYTPTPREEPQLVLSKTAKARFRPLLRYGRRNKVELFARMGVPGPWDLLRPMEAWEKSELTADPMIVEDIEEKGVEKVAWTTRLSPGQVAASGGGGLAMRYRSRLRHEANTMLMSDLDLKAALTLFNFSRETMLYYPNDLDRILSTDDRNRLTSAANESYSKGPWTLTDKSDCRQEHFCRDIVITDKDPSDRRRVSEFQKHTTTLALAYRVTGHKQYADAAVLNLRTWFVNKRLSMVPRISYPSDFQNLHSLLDAIKMVKGAFPREKLPMLHEWFHRYLRYLKVKSQTNDLGIHGDVQMVAASSFLGRLNETVTILHRSISRLDLPVPVEDLSIWTSMARMASRIGLNYWRYRDSALCKAVESAGDSVGPSIVAEANAHCSGQIDHRPKTSIIQSSSHDAAPVFWDFGLSQAKEVT